MMAILARNTDGLLAKARAECELTKRLRPIPGMSER